MAEARRLGDKMGEMLDCLDDWMTAFWLIISVPALIISLAHTYTP